MLLLKLGGGPSPHDGDDDSPGDVDLVNAAASTRRKQRQKIVGWPVRLARAQH